MKAIKENRTRPHVHSVAVCAFFICTALTGHAAELGDFTYVEYDTYIEITDYPTSNVGEVIIPSEIVGKPVTSIREDAFRNCSSLTSVTIPNTVTSIGDFAFLNCTSLTSVSIPDSVTSIGENGFTNCGSLTSVTIPDSVISIGEQAFFSIVETSLTAITVNASNTAYSSLDGVLFDKNQSTLIRWPGGRAGPYTIPESVTSIGFTAFSHCRGLTSLTIPDSVTSIGLGAFVNCSKLAIIAIPNGVTSIEKNTFWGCSILANLTIPDSVTSIGETAFNNCTGLTNAMIGDGVTSIGTRAFWDCTDLTSVYFKGNAPSDDDTIFEGADNATVYYLPGTTGWGETFGDRPTEEISVLPDRLILGAPVSSLEGWFLSDWFGIYGAKFAPWLNHARHGFLYRFPESTNESMFIYDDAMVAWWWTNETIYPFLYRFSDGVWLWYHEGSSGPRWFYNLDSGSWEPL